MTTTFVKDLLERAVKTFAQVLVTFFLGDVTVLNVNWGTALAVSATATLVSALTSVASMAIANNGTASLVSEIEDAGRHAAP